MRTERDFLGNVEVPEDAYYGAHTARAMVNFPISGFAIGKLPELVKSLGFVKKAAALANHRLGDLTNEQAKYICNACDDLIAGRLHDHFPVDVYQGGAGTSTNMNANEVIANRALELWGYPLGSYDRIHPNNDVNLSQSTNDVYPTAVRLSILRCQATLEIALGELAAAFEERASSFGPIMKLGRTQLQDAVPMTLAQEFTAFASTIYEDVARLRGISAIMREINLGGTAIGTGINASREYQRIVVEELSKLTGIAFIAAADLIEACWDTGAFVLYSGMLKRTATKLSKICNDLRLLSSGPRGGLNEINLPSMQPGSSIMPGKVNPVIPEVVNQIAFQVIGHDLTVTMASEAGQLQLNAMEPVITFCVLQSLQLLTSACDVLRNKCVSGITANAKNCTVHLEVSTAVATALTPSIGYERAASIAKEVLHSGRNIRDVIAERDDISEDIKLMVADARAFTEPASRGH
ncbi:aspartate ammonia-lyase [Ensifer sp. ENS04]|nr:aspartate ammonia-lyase [Ensifer sp. ENS04]